MSNLEANKTLVRKAVEALGNLEVEKFLSYLSDDVAFETPVRHKIFAGQKTKADLRIELPMMKQVLPDGVKLTVDSMTAEDDRVHAEISGKATSVDGKDYSNRYHYAVVVRDGKIVAFRDYFDSLYAIETLEPAIKAAMGSGD